jgi:alpha-mannosidase
VEVDPRRAFVTAWKPADGDGLILRLWETAGQSAPLVLRLHGFKSALATDLLERDLHALPVTSGQVSVDLRAHGFAAIRLLR